MQKKLFADETHLKLQQEILMDRQEPAGKQQRKTLLTVDFVGAEV